MRETTHTQGPWDLQLSDDRSYINAPDGHLIAEVGTWMNEEQEANARLIAASPDLLAACRLALTFINNGIEFGYITMPDKGDSALLTPEFLRAAIAKAEGVGASPPGGGKESR